MGSAGLGRGEAAGVNAMTNGLHKLPVPAVRPAQLLISITWAPACKEPFPPRKIKFIGQQLLLFFPMSFLLNKDKATTKQGPCSLTCSPSKHFLNPYCVATAMELWQAGSLLSRRFCFGLCVRTCSHVHGCTYTDVC